MLLDNIYFVFKTSNFKRFVLGNNCGSSYLGIRAIFKPKKGISRNEHIFKAITKESS
jgi:hypothetical protein